MISWSGCWIKHMAVAADYAAMQALPSHVYFHHL